MSLKRKLDKFHSMPSGHVWHVVTKPFPRLHVQHVPDSPSKLKIVALTGTIFDATSVKLSIRAVKRS